MPVLRRIRRSLGASSGSKRMPRPPDDKSCLAENTVAGASSTSVFHSAQSAHWPCQRWVTLPQAWQAYRRLGLAML
jgi:hypothetical protein